MVDAGRLNAFFSSRRITRHGPSENAGGSADPATNTRKRAACALAAALSVGACTTTSMTPDGHDPLSFPEMAEAAARHGGGAVTFVNTSSVDTYTRDVDRNRVAPDGSLASSPVDPDHKQILGLIGERGSVPQSMILPDENYGRTCTAIVGHSRDATDDFGTVGNTRVAFSDPNFARRFIFAHELGGHCSQKPVQTQGGVSHTRHLMENHADTVAAVLMSAEQGHTQDVRKVSDLRAIRTYQEAGAVGGLNGIVDTKVNNTLYMTSQSIDAAADWADKRLSLPGSHPDHLSNMRPVELISKAAEIAEQNAMSAGQMTRLNRHVKSAREAAPSDILDQNFRNAHAPRDPAIQPAFDRIRQAHENQFGPQATSEMNMPQPPAGKVEATSAGKTTKPAKSRGVAIGG